MKRYGKYIVIEGHDGTGKSTQVELLRERLANEYGIESVEMHEPAGVAIADKIRSIIKNAQLERDATTNLLLFTAARRELWSQLAVPALRDGTFVIAARSWLSTIAYQGYGEDLDPHAIEQITKQFTQKEYLHPDLSLILDLSDESERVRRINARGSLARPDTFESRADEFQQKVRTGYQAIARNHDIPVIDASASVTHVHEMVWQKVISTLLEKNI